MNDPSWRKSLAQFFYGDSLEERLLPWMAAATYLSSGLYLALFTRGIDFDSVYEAAGRLTHGPIELLYQDFFAFHPGLRPIFFMYPPPVAMFYSVFSFLPLWLAFGFFQLFSHLLLWSAIVFFCQTWCPDFVTRRRVVCLFLLFYPLYYCFQLGQSEAIVLWCLIASLKWFKEDHIAISSFVLVVAMELKLFLLLFILHFILVKQWRYVLWCIGWLSMWSALSWCLLPVNVITAYLGKLISPLGIEAFVDNQSLTGLLSRSLTFNEYTHGFVHWPETAQFLAHVASLAVIGYYGVILYRTRHPVPLEETFSLTIITGLLAAPVTDTHHFTLLLIPFAWLASLRKWRGKESMFYAFFAFFVPLWGFKFLSIDRGIYFAHHATHLLLSIPCFVLIAFWIYWVGRLRAKSENHKAIPIR